jgi:hypothetical protein
MNIITSALFSVVKKDKNGEYQFNTSVYEEIKNINKILLHTSRNDIITNPPLVKLYMILVPGVIDTDFFDVRLSDEDEKWVEKVNHMNFTELYNLPDSGSTKVSNLWNPPRVEKTKLNLGVTPKKPVYTFFKPITLKIHQTMRKHFYSQIDPEFRDRFEYIAYKVSSIEEYHYMTNLLAKGSFLDIVKARSIMEPGKNILHMDTNTLVIHWNELYKNTFGQVEYGLPERDVFGLSRCSLTYIAFHNKFLYVCKNSIYVPKLKFNLDYFLITNKQNEETKTATFNAIYDLVWAKSAHLCNYSHSLTVQNRDNPLKSFTMYPAAAARDIYGLNKYYITVQRQSWRENKKDGLPKKVLKKFKQTVNVNGYDIEIDEWFLESYRFLYTNIPTLEEKRFLHATVLYKKIDLIDYCMLMNKQPNEEYLQIMDALGVTKKTDECAPAFDARLQAEGLPPIYETTKENRCRAESLPNQLAGGKLYGGTNEDRMLIEEAYDYYLKEKWETVSATGGKTLKRKTKRK